MWLGLVGFFAFMAIINFVGAFVLGTSPVLPTVVAVVFVGGFFWLLRLWQRDRAK